jgi:hypothetical protein
MQYVMFLAYTERVPRSDVYNSKGLITKGTLLKNTHPPVSEVTRSMQ